MSVILVFLQKAITQGIPLLLGANGEILTEKSGNLNLGVPGIMYLGGYAGYLCAYLYENNAANPSAFVCVLLAMLATFIAAALGGLIFSFLTITLRANQNVTGLALTTFGMGVANFGGKFLLNESGYSSAPFSNAAFAHKILPGAESTGIFGQIFLSYGFLVYLAIILAVVMHFVLNKTRVGLNLRAVGENSATADAAGINVTLYKYLATCIGAGISGIGGVYYILDYNNGIWNTSDQIEALGWLAVALVIFTTWRPLNGIWGAYLFGVLYWLYQYLPNLLGISISTYAIDLVQMIPYVVTIVVLIVVSLRKKRENQPPASLGIAYFREER